MVGAAHNSPSDGRRTAAAWPTTKGQGAPVSSRVTRYETIVEDEVVSVATGDGVLEVADLDTIVDAVGGPAWTITYTDGQKRRYTGLDTSDEGLTVDVVDVLHAMTHGEQFVETLRACPADSPDAPETELSPRAGLFVGKLLENLESGID